MSVIMKVVYSLHRTNQSEDKEDFKMIKQSTTPSSKVMFNSFVDTVNNIYIAKTNYLYISRNI